MQKHALAVRAFVAIAACIALTAPPAAQPAHAASTSNPNVNGIVALVNDQPITGYEVKQRAMMLSGSDVQKQAAANFKAIIKRPATSARLKAILKKTIDANQGKSREQIIKIFDQRKQAYARQLQEQAINQARASALPGLKKKALDELIEERLKLQEAKRLGITVSDDNINKVLANIAQRNKLTTTQFLSKVGPGLPAMKDRIRSSLAWADVVRRRYGAQVSVSSRDVDKLIAKNAAGAEDTYNLTLQRITLLIPAEIKQYGVAQRMKEAEQIRAKFKGCKTTEKIAAGTPGANFDELGRRNPASFPEPTRTFLLSAKDGEMLPPTLANNGIELLAVCGRTVVKADEQMRNKAEMELKQREFELLAQRYIKDLRRDAHIEYR
ncbi:MAG: SurA N-terminal domain-containing protein [Hyphomicrobiaceae bacterium]